MVCKDAAIAQAELYGAVAVARYQSRVGGWRLVQAASLTVAGLAVVAWAQGALDGRATWLVLVLAGVYVVVPARVIAHLDRELAAEVRRVAAVFERLKER